jgi:hypothetical protein
MGTGLQAVCVFCGCNRGASPRYEQAAAATGRLKFVRSEHRRGIYFEDSPARLLELLNGFDPPRVHKWIDRDAP